MKIKFLVYFVVVYLAGTSSLHAQETLIFSTIVNSNSAKISEQVIREAYRRLGFDIEIVAMPARRALEVSNDGEVDGELHRIYGLDKRWQNLVRVPNKVNVLEATVFTKRVKFDVAGWNSIKPYVVGVRRGIQFSNRNTDGMSRQIVNSIQSLFEILKFDRVEVIVTSLVNGLSELKEAKISMIRPLSPPIEIYPLYHYLHKKNVHLLKPLTEVLRVMQQNGEIETIIEQNISRLAAHVIKTESDLEFAEALLPITPDC